MFLLIPNMSIPLMISLLFCLLSLASAVLPPGYEDELYCPSNSCLRRRKMQHGFAGPRSAFHECWCQEDGSIVKPKSWGAKIDPTVKEKLLQDKWHGGTCHRQE